MLVIYDQNGQLSRGGNGISSPIAGSYVSFMLDFNPVTVTFDPFNQTLATGAAPAFDGADPLLNFSTLPVDVIEFTLNENNYSNELKLSLSDADGELKKVMLQKSFNGIDFTDAGDMQEKAGSVMLKNFYYTDYNVYTVAYYRAKIIEANSEKYSKVIKTSGNLSSGVSIYPNPADKDVVIRWAEFTNSGAADVRIFNMDGKQVWSKTTSANFVSVSVAEFPAGAYLVQVSSGKEILVNKKLMIRR
ncbi:MAG: T9SS type A sorting domain-containing protein [Chitinophagaceae bacterium]|nr:T9SS type A sorting domain-containing protein [Chitinophagaceae bacterium]